MLEENHFPFVGSGFNNDIVKNYFRQRKKGKGDF